MLPLIRTRRYMQLDRLKPHTFVTYLHGDEHSNAVP
jgi:hypothetical protein